MRLINQRLGLLFLAFLVLLSMAFVRAFWLQGVRGGELAASAHSQQTETVDVPGHRGRVLDRNGKVLAVSGDAVSVIATPYQVKNPEDAAGQLAAILDEPHSEVLEKLSDSDSGFEYIARKVDMEAGEQIRKLKIKGISTLPDSRRDYPQGELASQVIGAVGVDNQGLTGLEESAEDTLRGETGEREIVRDALGETIRLDTVKTQSTGEEVRLTLDAAIQARTEEALDAAATKYDAKGATAIVMDPRNGDLLALANWPAFDPADLSDAGEQALLDRTTGFTYEPGSTFKAFTVAAALEERVVTPETVFNLPSTIKVADREIEEAHARPPISLSVSDILAQSSNVGSVMIGLELGSERFDPWIRKFGFGEPTGIEMIDEEQGLVPDLEDYSGSTMGNLPIGQGIGVTPLQISRAYAAIANDGVLPTPRLVTSVGGEPKAGEAGERVLPRRTSRRVRSMLEGVFAPGGTAEAVSVPGYQLAGKTGTAEKPEDGHYSKSKYIASFVGFAPAKNPELLVAVIVDEPVGSYYGSDVAAPVFGEVAQFALPYLGISPK